MCGLVGYFTGTFIQKDKDAFIDMLLMSQIRGLDSTGIIKLSQSPTGRNIYYEVDKEAIPAGLFLYERKYGVFQPTDQKRSLYGLLAHVRAATKGKISDENSHPFEMGDIVGMHNGTIRAYFEESGKFDTDSEGVFNLINKFGVVEGLKKVNKVDAAYALMFYNDKTGEISFIRNKERPLFMAFERKTNTYMVASEKPFLKYVEDKYDFKFDRLIQLAENKLYTLKRTTDGSFHFREQTVDVVPPKTTTTYTTTGSQYPYQGYGHSAGVSNPIKSAWMPPGQRASPEGTLYQSAHLIEWPTNEHLKKMEEERKFIPFVGAAGSTLTSPTAAPILPRKKTGVHTETGGKSGSQPETETSTNIEHISPEELARRIEEKEVFKNSKNEVIEGGMVHHAPFLNLSKHTWDFVVADGCVYCSALPHYSTRGKLHWVDDETFLCADCTKDPVIRPQFESMSTSIGHC